MLDPDLVLAAVVDAFQSIPAVVSELADDPTNIIGHTYTYGTEDSIARAIYSMRSPSILVAYLDLLGGNFDGATIWKHRLEVYLRPKNAASGAVGGVGGAHASSPPHVWWLLMNSVLGSTSQNFRQTSLLSGSLMLCDTPTLKHRTDEQGADLWVGQLVIPEWGDA